VITAAWPEGWRHDALDEGAFPAYGWSAMTRVDRSHRPSVTQPAPAAAPVAPPPPAAVKVRADRYAGGGVATPLPVTGTPSTSTSSSLNLRTAQLGGAGGALALDIQAVQGRLALARAAIPDLAEPGFEHALSVSLGRIQSAQNSGTISAAEAARSVDQLGEVVDALIALHAGKASVSVSKDGTGPGVTSYDVKTTEGDVLRVTLRAEGNAQGQARVKLQSVVDDGVVVPSQLRVMVRFDLAGSELVDGTLRAGWDVEFGSEKPAPGVELLDKRIHGIMLDDKGQPLLNRGGRSIADHHFWTGLPDALNDRTAFKAATQELLDTLLPVKP